MTLKVKISEIKNISFCEFDLPIEKGIYCLVGAKVQFTRDYTG